MLLFLRKLHRIDNSQLGVYCFKNVHYTAYAMFVLFCDISKKMLLNFGCYVCWFQIVILILFLHTVCFTFLHKGTIVLYDCINLILQHSIR